MRRLAAAIACLLWAVPALAIKGQPLQSLGLGTGRLNGTPINGESTTSDGPSTLDDTNFYIPPMLSSPVWRGTTLAGVTLSFVPKSSGTYRVRFATSPITSATVPACPGANCLTSCYKNRLLIGDPKDTDGTCNVTASIESRVDFVWSDGQAANANPLNQDTRYYYVVERQNTTTWARYPESWFKTLPPSGTTYTFAYIADEHTTQHYSASQCGNPSSSSYLSWATGIQTQSNILANLGAKEYRFYFTAGDTAILDQCCANAAYSDCTSLEGRTVGIGTGTGPGTVHTQVHADMRWLIYLRQTQPVLRYLPLVLSLGNHEGEQAFADQITNLTTFAGYNLNADSWYFDATNNLRTYATNARLKYIPNPRFTYNGTDGDGDPTSTATGAVNGRFYSVGAGDLELIVADAEGGVGNTAFGVDNHPADLNINGTGGEFPGDFPGVDTAGRGWNDWVLGADQCTYITNNSDCTLAPSAGGRLRDLTWTAGANNLNITWKFIGMHHVAGSTYNSADANKPYYGRGGMGAVDKTCSGGTRAGLPCMFNADCTGGGTCPAYTGLQTMNGGDQADLQAAMKNWAITVKGGAFAHGGFLLGHDHFGICGIKNDGGGSSRVVYCTGQQSNGTSTGPAWTDESFVVVASNWGGKNNAITGGGSQPDYCSTRSRAAQAFYNQETAACSAVDTGSFGSTIRGYDEVEVSSGGLVIRQVATFTPDESAAQPSIFTNGAIEWSMTVP